MFVVKTVELGAKLEVLGRVCRAGRLPADLRRLCATRMADGHDLHAGDPVRDWRTAWRSEAGEELADCANYLALGGERTWRVRIAVTLLGLVWRVLRGGGCIPRDGGIQRTLTAPRQYTTICNVRGHKDTPGGTDDERCRLRESEHTGAGDGGR